MRLFAEHGYESTSVADVAAAATVSPATFFTYFPSKEDVVFADHQARTEAVSQQLRSPEQDESPPGRLHRALSDMLTLGLIEGWDEELPLRGSRHPPQHESRRRSTARLATLKRQLVAIVVASVQAQRET
jgi:AcrR family transcriptional regulator